MTSFPLMVGVVSIGTAVGLGAFVVTGGVSARQVGADGSLSADGGPAVGVPEPTPQLWDAGAVEPLPPLLRRMLALASRLSPGNYAQRLQRQLDLAGNPRPWTADRILAFKGLGLIGGAIIGGLFGLRYGLGLVLVAAGGGALGFFIPDIMIHNHGQKRQLKILNGLPDALDMMTVCVEAGLGFDAALSRVALNLEGPMADECARVLQEVQFGLSRADALRALAGRTNVPELRTFISSLIQAGELGISIGDVLREQAKEMRVRRRQRAEEKAQKLPVKMLLPLITCLLPAMFVVVIGPALIHIMSTLTSLNR